MNMSRYGRQLGLAVAAAFFGTMIQSAVAQDELPAGEGRELTEEMCTSCHGSDRFAGLRQTEEQWRQTVSDMIGNGLQIFPDEAEEIVAYLTTNLGPQ